MNDEQIKTFLQVTKDGSFSKAEQQRYISKQSMLKQIEKLEEELSCKLFVRTSKGVRLSESGKTFYEGILRLQKDLNKLKEQCRDKDLEYIMKIGSVEHQVLLNPVTELFRKTFHEVEIKQIIHPNHSGEYRIANGIMDVGETFRLPEHPWNEEFEYTKLKDFPYYVAMKDSHYEAVKDTLSIKDLEDYPTIIFPMMVGEKYTKQIENAFKNQPDNLIESMDVDHQVDMAYSLLNNDSLIVGANPFIYNIEGLKILPLKEKWKREYGIIYSPNPNPVVQKYIMIAKKYYHAK